jgi:hypothetical protein
MGCGTSTSTIEAVSPPKDQIAAQVVTFGEIPDSK